jgi:hypothetical protein
MKTGVQSNSFNLKNEVFNYFWKSVILFMLITSFKISHAQEDYKMTPADSLSIEEIIVEKYYTYIQSVVSDTAVEILPEGTVTYRIFVDLKPGYSLQVVFGDENQDLYFKTSTSFFNDTVCFASTGFNIDAKKLHVGNVALDSWITMGAASRLHTGILRSEDDYGEFSFVPQFDSLSKADGLTKGVLPNFKLFNLDLSFFKNKNDLNFFSSNDGAWAALGGVTGPTSENKVLIAQLTTNGKFSFALNLQIGTPSGGFIQFVAKNPNNSQILYEGLNWQN